MRLGNSNVTEQYGGFPVVFEGGRLSLKVSISADSVYLGNA